ncbi:amidohydrolase [Candidatus Bipolaricaulota bacterium]|nr:amidohydrolase [Candidatus Bipolaricaulota bacterium]
MGDEGEVTDGLIILKDGEIDYVGPYDSTKVPEDADVVDFGDQTILPGLIDAHTHVGVHEDGEGWEGQDTNEMTDPVTPQVKAIDGINPAGLGLQDAVNAGVTTVNTGPGSGNVIGGQFAAVKTSGSIVLDELLIKEPTAMKMATGENPKRVYKEKDSIPSTRIGTGATLREALFDAKDYIERKKENGEDNSFKKDYKLEALVPVLKGDLRAKIHAHRADDIITAIRIAEEFDLDYSIDHCTEGHKIVDFLAEHESDAVVGPSMTSRSKRELVERTFKTPGLLAEAGVRVAITTDSPVIPIQYLPLLAAFAVREGMDRMEALKAITINSARIAQIDDRVGSLEPGKDGDFIVTDGSIFDLENNLERVFVEGHEVDRSELPKSGKSRTF